MRQPTAPPTSDAPAPETLMPDTMSVTLVKQFNYRGKTEQWSNKYHLDGASPGSPAEWRALIVAIWNVEKTFMQASTTLVKGYGYQAGNDNSVYQLDVANDPTGITGGNSNNGNPGPGDVAATVRWLTPNRSSKGKPIYLRKYFHGIGLTLPDNIHADNITLMNTNLAKLTDGSLPAGHKLVGPQGAPAGTMRVQAFATTRTLKRRGKRPSS